VLRNREQRALHELEQCFAVEAAEPVPPGSDLRFPRWRTSHPANRALVVVGWLAGLLLIADAVLAAFAIGTAGFLGWLLWRSWPQLRNDGVVPAPLRPPLVPGHAASTHPRRREWLAHYIERIAEVE
jgi:hypothetical protein